MDCLTFNAVLRIDTPSLDGFFRVVAVTPGSETVWLAYVGPRESDSPAKHPAAGSLVSVDRQSLGSLVEASLLAGVHLDDPNALVREEELSDAARLQWEVRRGAMRPFLDPLQLSDSLCRKGGIGPLVQKAVNEGRLTRSTIYRLWKELCIRGFTALSLMPMFDQCGAPGVLRPVEGGRSKPGAKSSAERMGADDPFPQRGITTDDRVKITAHAGRLWKPGMKYGSLYEEIMEAAYVNRYVATAQGREPVLPPQRHVSEPAAVPAHHRDRVQGIAASAAANNARALRSQQTRPGW